jgi:hypothetical protein
MHGRLLYLSRTRLPIKPCCTGTLKQLVVSKSYLSLVITNVSHCKDFPLNVAAASIGSVG